MIYNEISLLYFLVILNDIKNEFLNVYFDLNK